MKCNILSSLCLAPILCWTQNIDAARQQAETRNRNEIALSLEIVVEDNKGRTISHAAITKANAGASVKGLFFDFDKGPNTISVYYTTRQAKTKIGSAPNITAAQAPLGTEIELFGSTAFIKVRLKKPNTDSAKTGDQKNISAIIPSMVPTAPEPTTPATEELVAPEAPPFGEPTAPAEPVAPEAPPFVQPIAVTSPKESTPRSDLLDQIKAGKTLKKTTAEPKTTPASKDVSSGISSDLQKQIEERRKAIEEEEEEDVDASEWD